ncbi:MAG: aldehyde dehydrogenase, partial [Clostridia bacterium]|nr:aldehyde dehydrogenase [Clostridia bacterium]
MKIEQIVERQRTFFRTDRTKSLGFRMEALNRLEESIKRNEKNILQALKKDLNKSAYEAYMTEVGMTYSELTYVKRHLPLWNMKKRHLTPLAQFPAESFTVSDPYGVVLVMSPWNYPFLLCMDPLIGAIAAGNCCILKPSAYAPNVSQVMADIIEDVFPEKYVTVIQGGRKENTELLEQRFDYIFFTGGVTVGKLVMEKASRNLTPVTLELGGKSPCIVTKDAKLMLAAKRLVFGKFLNSGQTCIAPDYLLIDEKVKEEFLAYIVYWIGKMLGKEPLDNPDYPKMINEKHYHRVLNLITGEKISCGGYGNDEKLQITPTVLEDVSWDAPVMQEEIFGPVLPVLTYKNLDEAIEKIKDREKPLALYLFTENPKIQKKILTSISYGGGCINDTIIHLATSRMP